MLLNSVPVFADTSDLLVGGTITDRSTKTRIGVLCSSKQKVQMGDVQVEQCTKYEVVSLNGQNEADHITDLTVNYSSSPDSLKQLPARKLSDTLYSEVYDHAGIYPNINAPYFYALTAANAYGCSEASWGWCLLIPFSAIVDTVATVGINAAFATWDGVVLSIAGIDRLVMNTERKMTRSKMLKDIVFMLNTHKKGKNRNIAHSRFELFKSYL